MGLEKARLIALFFFVAWVGLAAQTGAAPATPPSENDPDILNHWRLATVALGQVIDEGGTKRFVTLGSAVLVGDGKRACLLTAKHMFFNPDNGWIPTQISMRLAKTQSNSETDLGVIIPLIVNGQNLWITTKTSSDLAVVALPKEINKYKNIHGVALRDFGTADDIYQGAAVYVLGYPGILGETYQTATVARGGIIAWTDPDNLEGKPFLVDANIFSGNSGGPVFHVRSGFDKHGRMDLGGGLVFIGIVSQDAQEYSDVVATDLINPALNRQLTQPNADPSKKPDRVITIVKNIGGIGVVEPAARARELVQDFFGLPHSTQ